MYPAPLDHPAVGFFSLLDAAGLDEFRVPADLTPDFHARRPTQAIHCGMFECHSEVYEVFVAFLTKLRVHPE